MSISTIYAFVGTFLSRLQADAVIGTTGTIGQPVQITWGTPAPAGPTHNWVSLGDVQSTQVAAVLGAQRREETYTMDLMISILRNIRTDPKDVAAFAFQVAGAIENSVRAWGARGTADPFNITETGTRTVQIDGFDFKELLGDANREARINIKVGVTARI